MRKSIAALAAGLLAIGAVAIAGPAVAAPPAATAAVSIAPLEVAPEPYLETSNELQCGSVDVTLHNVSPWLYRVLIETETSPGVWERVDGTVSGAGIYAAEGVLMVDNRGDASDDQTGTYTVTFPEDSGVHNVRYKVSSGAEADLYVGLPVGEFTTVQVESDCVAPEPIEPTETPAPGDSGTPSSTDGLAVTGGGVNPILPIGGAAALLMGALALIVGRLVRRHTI
ncbi:MAG TPA: hypothetical protein VFN24_01030 [Microbacterium sp.]|nr:hypothetical protein [Microbacterium sp.]